jgi:stage II sporulation protein D
MKGNDFRLAVGPSALKSLFFTAKVGANAVEFTGHGWGHGCGLCQYGAKGLAELGKTFDAIVKFYYPDTELRKAY